MTALSGTVPSTACCSLRGRHPTVERQLTGVTWELASWQRCSSPPLRYGWVECYCPSDGIVHLRCRCVPGYCCDVEGVSTPNVHGGAAQVKARHDYAGNPHTQPIQGQGPKAPNFTGVAVAVDAVTSINSVKRVAGHVHCARGAAVAAVGRHPHRCCITAGGI